MPHLQSAALKSVFYDVKRHSLRATFRDSGCSYVYEDVPLELYDALLFADSVGSFFNQNIRDRFVCRKV